MTKQSEVINDPKYIPVLDHGFVGLVDHMGSDAAVVRAARVSYGDGTKTVREDRGLIRYLMRHKHTSPVEMCEVKLHIRCPIVVMRQLVRHRTASLNEYSGRYSVMTDEFYLPDPDVIQPQSALNKQGRAGEIDDVSKEGVRWLMKAVNDSAYDTYQALLTDRTVVGEPVEWLGGVEPYDAYDPEDPLLTPEYPGLSRELARMVLPVSAYTELYWKQDLHNLLHLLKLRTDSHAQYEIRAFADAIYQIVKPLFPFVVEAWEDYVRDAVTFSRMEMDVIRALLSTEQLRNAIEKAGGEKDFAKLNDMSMREVVDLVMRFSS